MYTLGSMEFESLVELVEYYTQHPLMRKTKLTDPIDEELLALKGDDEEEDFYSCGDLYQTPNEAFEMVSRLDTHTQTHSLTHTHTHTHAHTH